MTLDELKAHLEATTPALCRAVGYVPSELPRLSFVRHSSVTPLEATVYEPVLCLILRGRKRTLAGTLSVDFGPGESLIVSHVVPVVSAITEAPYLALLDALGRYASLALKPDESRFLGPLVLKEIHFRLFRAAHGGMLRELLAPDSDASRIHRAVQLIRQDYRTGISVSDLARTSGMSESVFFRKFKDITGNTPLGFLKAMRLLEARRLLSADAHNVTEAALEVGYTSPSQFSREYSRAFGVTPSTHAQGR
jgi:AraC-like DNA-binding protein